MDMQWSCHVTDEWMNCIRGSFPSPKGIAGGSERAIALSDGEATYVRKAAIIKKSRCVAELKPHGRDVAKDFYHALPEKAGCHRLDRGNRGTWPHHEGEAKASTGGIARQAWAGQAWSGQVWFGSPWSGRL